MTSSNSLINKQEQRFQHLALLTVLIIYLLILAGGIVRGTGSGMGCPDWPKCFGRWIPPTELSQLPANYQEIYGAKLKGEVEFNAVKTWIEYVNRLLGVLSGFFVFATLLASFSYWLKKPAIVWGSIAAFLLIGANGWLGSRVVATELAQYMITLHLLLAILVMFALLYVLVQSKENQIQASVAPGKRRFLQWFLALILIATLGQILLGAQVRDVLDTVVRKLGYEQRENWINELDWHFYVHRSFSLVLLALHLIIIYRLKRASPTGWLVWIPQALLSLVIAEIATGIVMAYLGVPAIAQPVHLLLAMLIIGLQFVALLIITSEATAHRDITQESELITL
jgi:cytochrome c oxidase assembly protein subunit 15